MFAALVLIGILAQGCSDNNGRVTPTSAKVTGDGIGGPGSLSLFVQVTINPGTIDKGRRASVLVIVTNANGFPLAGRRVDLAPSGGRLDQTTGITDANGLFSTTLLVSCEAVGTIGVAAVVEGVTAQAAATVAPPSAVDAVENSPCPPPVVVPPVA